MGVRRVAVATALVTGVVGASVAGSAGLPAAATAAVQAAPVQAAPVQAAPVRAAAVRAAPVQVAPLDNPRQAATSATPRGSRWSRETVRYGDRDTSPYQISHVYEVQIRLARVGAYRRAVTGYFGAATRTAVTRFQRSQKLPRTGMVDQATWSRLIWYSTLRSPGWAQLPAVCRSAGWHSCYSRPSHELFALHNGALWNSWLVRGGSRSRQTVLGTHRVYWRDLHHRSREFHNAPMPYSQFFFGGEAMHGSATMMDPRYGHSSGCINMYIEDAAELWRLTTGSANVVTVFGAWG